MQHEWNADFVPQLPVLQDQISYYVNDPKTHEDYLQSLLPGNPEKRTIQSLYYLLVETLIDDDYQSVELSQTGNTERYVIYGNGAYRIAYHPKYDRVVFRRTEDFFEDETYASMTDLFTLYKDGEMEYRLIRDELVRQSSIMTISNIRGAEENAYKIDESLLRLQRKFNEFLEYKVACQELQ